MYFVFVQIIIKKLYINKVKYYNKNNCKTIKKNP